MTVLSSHPELEEFGNPRDEGIAGLRRLHEFANRVLQANDLHSVLDEILTAAEELTHADMGNLQLVDSEGALRIACQHGFSTEFLEFFGSVLHSENACGAALQQRKQVCVEDVEQSPIFAGTPALPVMLKAGARAVQSTPIVTRDGRLLGIFSTHYKTPYRPAESDLRLVSLLAAQAANLIERFRAEEQLRQAQQDLATITENMPAAVTRCSRDFRYLWVSPAYAARLGLTREAITGRPIREVFGEWAFRQILPYFERVLSGERVEYTTRLDVASIGEKWVHVVYMPTFSRDGRVDGWISVVTDIEEAKKQEQQLRDLNSQLRHANEDLTQFAFAASHDLHEPLRMITTYSQLLIRHHQTALDPETSQCIKVITEGSERMQALLADLLAYTQLVGNGPVEVTTTDLNAVFQKAVENCRAAIQESQAMVTADRLPSIAGSEPLLVQLFQNLLSNALKYRADQRPQVHVSAMKNQGMWQLAVTDNGIGIAPEYYDSIFTVFKRLHRKRVPGTGVGLAICKRVVERHGGSIWVESQPNEGSTFYFTLPAVMGASAS